MKGKTKAILAIISSVAVVAVAATGTVAFLKDSGETAAAEEPSTSNILPITGNDNEIENVDNNAQNLENTNAGEGESNLVDVATNTAANTNTSNQNAETRRNTGTSSNEAQEPETTTVLQERIIQEATTTLQEKTEHEETTLNWNNISFEKTIIDKTINYLDFNYTIEYYYEGINGVFQLDDTLTVKNKAAYLAEITDYSRADHREEKAGYIVSKIETTDSNGILPLTITENPDANLIKVYYVRNNFSYKVNHYTEKLDGLWELKATDVVDNMKFGDSATYNNKTFTGFEFDDTKTTPKNATVPANNDLEINLYYTRKSYNYTVNFIIEGTSTPFETYTKPAKFEEVITISQEEIDNTNLDMRVYNYKPGKTDVKIGEGNNVINIYYTEIIKTSNTVEYATTIRKTNLVITMDLSSSMTEYGSTRLQNAKIAACNFIDQIYNNQDVSGINIRVVTFNTRNPIVSSINYSGITECNNPNHYTIFGHISVFGTGGCRQIGGTWYSEFESNPVYAPFSGTQVLSVPGLANNTATNYQEAQNLKTAINGIYIPSNYIDGGYGTHMYAALQESNRNLTALQNSAGNNSSVLVFLSDGKPQQTGDEFVDNTMANITAEANRIKANSTIYCIRLGNEAQSSSVFGNIATSGAHIIDATTHGDLINGFTAITERENEIFSNTNSSGGIITYKDVDLVINTEKPVEVRKADNTMVSFYSIEELNNSGFISYNTSTKTLEWDVRDYPETISFDIKFHVK